MRRPAVMAAAHSTIEANARVRTLFETGFWSISVSSKTLVLMRIRAPIASAISDILIQNTALTPTVVASFANNSRPDTAFSANPSHIIAKNFSSGLSGMPEAPPRIRRLTTTVAPTIRPRPMVCSARTRGNAQSEDDSRSHVLSPLASRRIKRSIIRRSLCQVYFGLPDNYQGGSNADADRVARLFFPDRAADVGRRCRTDRAEPGARPEPGWGDSAHFMGQEARPERHLAGAGDGQLGSRRP